MAMKPENSGPVLLKAWTERILQGGSLTPEEALRLPELAPLEDLIRASARITRHCCGRSFDLCSIINAKSGKCPEDCGWCAQSARYRTGISVYPLVPVEETMRHAVCNEQAGIRRFSWVTSGKRLTDAEVDRICAQAEEVRRKTGLQLCASLGLIGEEALRRLRRAGITRYHCNLETAPSRFPELCTTHTQEQKQQTLDAARRAGMDLCCGGILGMGETWAQRVEFAFRIRETGADSIPLNLLQPIPGTPLEHQPPLSEEEVLTAVVLFRFVHPKARLRLAGGRARLSRETVRRAMEAGINAAIAGDLLTTVGSKVAEDLELIKNADYDIS